MLCILHFFAKTCLHFSKIHFEDFVFSLFMANFVNGIFHPQLNFAAITASYQI